MFSLLFLQRALNFVRGESETVFGGESYQLLCFSKLRAVEFDIQSKDLTALPVADEIVGISSTRFGTLKAGLSVPLLGCVMMYVFYLRKWTPPAMEV